MDTGPVPVSAEAAPDERRQVHRPEALPVRGHLGAPVEEHRHTDIDALVSEDLHHVDLGVVSLRDAELGRLQRRVLVVTFDRLPGHPLVDVVGAEDELRLRPVLEIGARAQRDPPVRQLALPHGEDEQSLPVVQREGVRVLVSDVDGQARPVDPVGRDAESVRRQRALVAPGRVRVVGVVDDVARGEPAGVLAQVYPDEVVVPGAAVLHLAHYRFAPMQAVIALPVGDHGRNVLGRSAPDLPYSPLRVPDHRPRRRPILVRAADHGALLLGLMHRPDQVLYVCEPMTI